MRTIRCSLLLAWVCLTLLGCGPQADQNASFGAPTAASGNTAAALPADDQALWEGLPLCHRARLLEDETTELQAFAAQARPPGRAAAYTCDQDVSDVLAMYRGEMPSLGWQKSLDLADGEGGVLLWEQDQWNAQVMVAHEGGETILLLGMGPLGAALLPAHGVGPTPTPQPTRTSAPTPTATLRPAGLDALKVYPQALAAAQDWGGDVLLLKVHSNYDLRTKVRGLDLEGAALDWTFHFAHAHPTDDQGALEWLTVTVSHEGVMADPYTSMLASSSYQIADAADWAISSAEAFQIAEENGGRAYRQAMEPAPPVQAELRLACMTGCGGERGLVWEIRYLGAPSHKVFEIDATTGEVLMSR